MGPAYGGPAASPAIVSTTGVQNEFNNVSNELDQFHAGGDPYAVMFANSIASEQAANANAQGNAIASATAKSANAESRNAASEAAAISGAQTQGETSGASRYLPEYEAGIIDSTKQAYNQRFQLLDQQEKLAIANATAARNVADVKTAREQLDYAKALRTEKAKAISDAQNMAWKQYVFTHLSAGQQATADRLANGALDKPLVPGSITALNKQNPLINLTYGDTSKSAQDAVQFAQKIPTALVAAKSNPTNVGPQGFLKYDYFSSLLDSLPTSINRAGFIKAAKPYLAFSNYRTAKNYGITRAEYDEANK